MRNPKAYETLAENPPHNRSFIPSSNWRLGGLAMSTDLGYPQRKVTLSRAQLVYFTRYQKEPRRRDPEKNPCSQPRMWESIQASSGEVQGPSPQMPMGF
jgi:hypothetical protein